jgi:hypothetical protein
VTIVFVTVTPTKHIKDASDVYGDRASADIINRCIMPYATRYIWDAYVSYGYANTRPRGQDPETHIGRGTGEEHAVAVALVLRQANQT